MTAVPDTTSTAGTTHRLAPAEAGPAAQSQPNLATLARLRGRGRNALLLPASRRARRS